MAIMLAAAMAKREILLVLMGFVCLSSSVLVVTAVLNAELVGEDFRQEFLGPR